MNLSYLTEHADSARIALNLAERESVHLRYTYSTLYEEPIDLAWVEALSRREDLAEKIDAFVGRFGRLQDHIGDKLLPIFIKLVGGQPRTLLDTVAYSERMGWVENGEEFVGSRKLRNFLVHEYMTDPEFFLEALLAAKSATEMLFRVVAAINVEASTRGLIPSK